MTPPMRNGQVPIRRDEVLAIAEILDRPDEVTDDVFDRVKALQNRDFAKEIYEAHKSGPAGEFVFLTEEDLEVIPTPEPLVDGLLFRASKARLFGPSTVGKTWVVLDVAAHVACGLPWQGREVTHTAVLYVAAEGAPSIGPRLRVWREHHGRRTGIVTWPEPVQIGGADWPAFVEACRRERFGLVVIDTQSASTVGREENSNSDWAQVNDALGELVRATNACVLLVHHTGHEETYRARGASGAFAGLDTELRLTAGRDGGVVLCTDKQKYAEPGRPVGLSLVSAHGGVVVAAGAVADRDTGNQKRNAAEAHVAALEGNHADPGRSQNVLLKLLRELGREGDDHVMKDAIKLFKHRSGAVGVVLPSYLRSDDPADLLPELSGSG